MKENFSKNIKEYKYPKNFIYYLRKNYSHGILNIIDFTNIMSLEDNIIEDTINYVVKNAVNEILMDAQVEPERAVINAESIEYTFRKRFGIDTDGIFKTYDEMTEEYNEDRKNMSISSDTFLRTNKLRSFIFNIESDIVYYLRGGGVYNYIDNYINEIQDILNKFKDLNNIYESTLNLYYTHETLDIGNHLKRYINHNILHVYNYRHTKTAIKTREVLEHILSDNTDNADAKVLRDIARNILQDKNINLLNYSVVYDSYIKDIVNISTLVVTADDELFKYSKKYKDKTTFLKNMYIILDSINYEYAYKYIIDKYKKWKEAD